jgi:hypothetical protein
MTSAIQNTNLVVLSGAECTGKIDIVKTLAILLGKTFFDYEFGIEK